MKKLFIIFLCSLGLIFIAPYSSADLAQGGNIDSFDIQPRLVSLASRDVKVTFYITVWAEQFKNYCGNNPLHWKVLEHMPTTVKDTKIKDGLQAIDVNGGQQSFDFSFPTSLPVRTTTATRKFYAVIECNTITGKNIATSEDVPVNVQNGAGSRYACIAGDGKYSCTTKEDSSCSNAVGCSERPCLQVDSSSCGAVATDFAYSIKSGASYICSQSNKDCSDIEGYQGQTCYKIPKNYCGTNGRAGGAVCGNDKCESGETQESCPADCKPGETQTYSFNIPNPLKGGASDFTSLVKIIAQWIFNLAIPIAVAMIVYSGILFLTAAGEPAKVTKAKDVLKWAVVGLAIILIGSGFVTLIQSILELGGTGTGDGSGKQYTCQNKQCVKSSGGKYDNDTCDDACGTTTGAGAVGNTCSKDSNCSTGLKCKNTICQREAGNLEGEACVGPTNCASGLDCDKSDSGLQEIDGQTLGSCIAQ